jgi:hypothetical protein
MSAISEEHYNGITPKYNTRSISSFLKLDALPNLVRTTLYYADMTGDVALLSGDFFF